MSGSFCRQQRERVLTKDGSGDRQHEEGEEAHGVIPETCPTVATAEVDGERSGPGCRSWAPKGRRAGSQTSLYQRKAGGFLDIWFWDLRFRLEMVRARGILGKVLSALGRARDCVFGGLALGVGWSGGVHRSVRTVACKYWRGMRVFVSPRRGVA
jgi:hypothetical protein